MPDLSVNRTLVKSPPELWSEVSEVESLAQHLGEFGEIAISRTEPEHTVTWEGEHARGTVELEQAGWGTKVTLSAELAVVEPEPAPEPEPEPQPVAEEPEPEPEVVKVPWYRRWFGRAEPVADAPEPVAVEPEPEPAPEPEPVPEPVMDPDRAVAVLEDTLDHLGAAHHRPFSREG